MLSKFPNDSIDVTIRHLTSTHSFPGFFFRRNFAPCQWNLPEKNIHLPKVSIREGRWSHPHCLRKWWDFGAGNGGFGKPHPLTNSVRDPVLY